VSYLDFLLAWYNWPYLIALTVALVSLARPEALERSGATVARWLRLERLSGISVMRMLSVCIAVVGLTVNGAIHDYWPRALETASLAGLLLTLFTSVVFTRALGAMLQRHFPRIKDVRWGGEGLAGQYGRVVSRKVSPDYRAGRAQVLTSEETLYMVLCKTREGEIPYGAEVELVDYDAADGRYFVIRVEDGSAEQTEE